MSSEIKNHSGNTVKFQDQMGRPGSQGLLISMIYRHGQPIPDSHSSNQGCSEACIISCVTFNASYKLKSRLQTKNAISCIYLSDKAKSGMHQKCYSFGF